MFRKCICLPRTSFHHLSSQKKRHCVSHLLLLLTVYSEVSVGYKPGGGKVAIKKLVQQENMVRTFSVNIIRSVTNLKKNGGADVVN